MKKLFVCLLAGALLTVTATTTEAAKQIAYGKGKSSASVNGKVQGSNDVDYVIRAGAGQTLTVDFKASKAAAYFNVLPPDSKGDAIFIGSSEGNHFKAALPSDGDYTLRVYLMGGAKDSDKPVTFTLKVSIPATGKADSGVEAAKKACLRYVAEQVGIKVSQVSVIDTQGSQAGINVNIKVPDATAPWSCLSDKKGNVQGARFTGSDGAM